MKPFPTNHVFKEMQAAFDRAADTHPTDVYQSYYKFAGRLVRLRVVGRRLMEHTSRSLAHLQISEPITTEPQLAIDLWDENVTGVACPDKATGDELGKTWVMRLRRVAYLTLSPDGRLVRCRHEGCTTWLDRNIEHIIGWRSWENGVCMDEYADPISLLLYTWYSDQGVQVIHAGLVSQDGHGVLFAAPSGSGKTISTLACLCAGLDYLGDDRVGLEICANGSFVGHSVYDSTQMEPESLVHFPSLASYAIPGDRDGDRVLIHLTRIFPERIKRFVPIRAIALPRIVNAPKPRIQPASRGETLLALTPSTKLMPFYPGKDYFHNSVQLVQGTPAYWLNLNRRLGEIPFLVRQILAEAGGQTSFNGS